MSDIGVEGWARERDDNGGERTRYSGSTLTVVVGERN